MGKIYRQGDVLLEHIGNRGMKPGKRCKRDKGRIVLAYGEVTGHAHAIASRDATLFEIGDLPVDNGPDGEAAWRQAQRFLKVRRTVALEHEEHGTIKLPPGNYRVIRQREYSPQALRMVAD